MDWRRGREGGTGEGGGVVDAREETEKTSMALRTTERIFRQVGECCIIDDVSRSFDDITQRQGRPF